MNAQQRAVIHEQIEELAAAEEKIRVSRMELEHLLAEDVQKPLPLKPEPFRAGDGVSINIHGDEVGVA